MVTQLRQVLNAFEVAHQPRTLKQLAQELKIAPGILEGMIAHWVHKGKLRETGGVPACTACDSVKNCSYLPHLPRSYELVTKDSQAPASVPPYTCGEA